MELKKAELGKHALWHSDQGWRAGIGIIYPGAGCHHIADFTSWRPKAWRSARTTVSRR
jgi:hypothetical protein